MLQSRARHSDKLKFCTHAKLHPPTDLLVPFKVICKLSLAHRRETKIAAIILQLHSPVATHINGSYTNAENNLQHITLAMLFPTKLYINSPQ